MSFQMTELMEGARNWVIGHGEVSKGENVLIWTDSSILDRDPHLPEALATAAREAGADVTIIVSDPSVLKGAKMGHLGFADQSFPPVIREAVQASDAVIKVTEGQFHWGDHDPSLATVDYGVRFVVFPPSDSKILTTKYAKFPAQLSNRIQDLQYEILIHGKEIHVTTPSGTDLIAGIDPKGVVSARMRGPGSFVQVGGMVGLVHFMKDANGICIFDAPPFEGSKVPLKWTVKDRRVISVDGGGEISKVVSKMISEDQNLNLFDNLLWTTTPGSTIAESIQNNMVIYRGGTVWGGMGSNRGQAWGNIKTAAKFHGPHAYWFRATVNVDDVCLIKDGYPTTWMEPEIVDLARKYGEPTELLPSSAEYPR